MFRVGFVVFVLAAMVIPVTVATGDLSPFAGAILFFAFMGLGMTLLALVQGRKSRRERRDDKNGTPEAHKPFNDKRETAHQHPAGVSEIDWKKEYNN